jgi:hypothetical protein
MGTTATSIARLERALAHGKTPKPSEWSQFRYGAHTARIAGGASRWQRPLWKRPSNGTGHRQTGQTDANPANAGMAGRDLGGLKGCQMRGVDNRAPLRGLGVQRTRRTTWRILPTRLQSASPVASVALRLTAFTQLPQPATLMRQPRCRGTVESETGCWCICAHSVDICVEAREVAVPDVPARQGKGTDNSRSLLRVSASRSDARRLPRRLRSHQ